MLQHLCIIYTSPEDPRVFGGGGFYASGNVIISLPSRMTHQSVLIHELCHAWQDYYRATKTKNYAWRDTPAGKEFINIVGFVKENDRWVLPADNPYRVFYNFGKTDDPPVEVNADLCALFLFRDYGFTDGSYKNIAYSTALRDEQLKQWFNTYLVNVADIPTTPEAQNPRIVVGFRNGVLSYRDYYRNNFTLEAHKGYYRNGEVRIGVYYYDAPFLGTIQRFELYREDGTIRQINYFNTSKQKTRIEHYNTQGNLTDSQSISPPPEKARVERREIDGGYTLTRYRADDTIEYVHYYNADGTKNISYYYQTNGLSFKRAEIYENNRIDHIQHYHANGIQKSIEHYDTDGITRTRTEHYNTQGNLVRTTS